MNRNNGYKTGDTLRCIRLDAYDGMTVHPGTCLEALDDADGSGVFLSSFKGRQFLGDAACFEVVPAAPPAGFDHFTFPEGSPQPECNGCTVPDKALAFIREELAKIPPVCLRRDMLEEILERGWGLKPQTRQVVEFVPIAAG